VANQNRRIQRPTKASTEKPRAGAEGKRGASEARPIKVREGEKAPVLLSGGNPRIAKADGDAPVQAYIAGMPGWKRAIGKRLDALVVRNVPHVRKAVKWNSPMYGVEGQGLFLAFHTFTHYVKVTFFRGTSLRPVPPGGTGEDARWIDIHEDDLDEAQMATWMKQAAALPGWIPGRPADSVRRPGTVKPKAQGASGAVEPPRSATRSTSPPETGATAKPASRLIDQRIRDLGGWRGETLARMRALILEADPEMTEEWKWMGTPVWSHHGIVCTGEAYTKVVKLTFARGARVPDPSRLFNSSLEGNTRRAIDIHEGEKVDARAFKALVKAAVAQNGPPAKNR
jgi:hypothetical protein